MAQVAARSEEHAALRTMAQVAVEAIINMPDAYEPSTMRQVFDAAAKAGVSDFYLEQLEALA